MLRCEIVCLPKLNLSVFLSFLVVNSSPDFIPPALLLKVGLIFFFSSSCLSYNN